MLMSTYLCLLLVIIKFKVNFSISELTNVITEVWLRFGKIGLDPQTFIWSYKINENEIITIVCSSPKRESISFLHC
jgi:hypothetical protein